MKNLKQIRRSAEKGDYTLVAQLVGRGPSLVKMVIKGERADHHHIQKVFSDMLRNREMIASREERRRARKAKRELKRRAV